MSAMPLPDRLHAAVDATWPAAAFRARDGWLLRRGDGGGQRVSSASALKPGTVPDIDAAESAMRGWGQVPLFRLGREETALDAALGTRGYAVVDPVLFLSAPVASLTDDADETARIIRISTPLALAEEIWDEGGIGPGRRAVMGRVRGPRVALMARLGDRPVAMAFVACDGEVAMLHAVQVIAARRREGAGRMLLTGAANWAAGRGAETLALAVTAANAPAVALYTAAGMAEAGGYHYRRAP